MGRAWSDTTPVRGARAQRRYPKRSSASPPGSPSFARSREGAGSRVRSAGPRSPRQGRRSRGRRRRSPAARRARARRSRGARGRASSPAQELADVGLAAPQHRRVAAGGHVRARRWRRSPPAMPSGVKLIIPIVPPGRRHADQLARDGAVVGSEHRAGGAGDDVEGVVGERQLLRVGLDPLDLEAARLGLAAAERELLGRDVARGHASRPAPPRAMRRCRCRWRRRGRASRADARVGHELGAEVPDQLGGEAVVVPGGPDGAHATDATPAVGAPRIARSGYFTRPCRPASAAAAARVGDVELAQDVGDVAVDGVLAHAPAAARAGGSSAPRRPAPAPRARAG